MLFAASRVDTFSGDVLLLFVGGVISFESVSHLNVLK